MAIDHIALATNDIQETHRFYTEAMGFRLAKVVAGPTPTGQGFSKHAFYDTGDGFIAFWDLHDPTIKPFNAGLSTGAGLPAWVNHLAFSAKDRDHLELAKQRWLDYGLMVSEIDHEWCRSIYTADPNGSVVEWCLMVRQLDEADAEEALRLLADPNPPLDPPLEAEIFTPAPKVPVGV